MIILLAVALVLSASAFAIAETTAISGANQQQIQQQGVYGSGNSGISGSANVTFSDSFNGSDPIRYLPVPSHVSVNTTGGPAFLGSPNYADNGPHFITMHSLVTVLNMIDTKEAKIKDEGDIEIVPQMLNSLTDEEKEAIGKANSYAKPKFFLNQKVDVTDTVPGFRIISAVTARADDNNTMNSATLAAKFRKHADEVGGTCIILLSEGTTKRLSSWGVGVGLSANYAQVDSKAKGAGGAGAGGTGWSWGEAEYFSLPYLTAVVGYVAEDLIAAK